MPRGVRRIKAETISDQYIEQTSVRDTSQVDQNPPVIKTKGTKPGWKPAGQLPKLKAPPGYTPKWASNDPAKLTKLRAEGWIIMKPDDNRGDPIIYSDVNDGGSIDGGLRYRDMVAMMLPNELKEARDEWVRNENREAMKNILKQTDDTFNEHGVQTYAPMGQEGRIVID